MGADKDYRDVILNGPGSSFRPRPVPAPMGANRALILSLIIEIAGLQPDTEEAVREDMGRGFGTVVAYMIRQMVAGRLRPIAPPLAFVSFAAPMLLVGLASPVMERLGMEVVPERAARELAELWLRGMRPD